MIGVFVLFIDSDHCWGSFHKICGKILKVLVKGLVGVNSNRLSVFNEKDVSRYQDLHIGSNSVFIDFV